MDAQPAYTTASMAKGWRIQSSVGIGVLPCFRDYGLYRISRVAPMRMQSWRKMNIDLVPAIGKAREKSDGPGRGSVPQGLKPALILRSLRHPSAALRAGFEVVP